MSPATFSAYRVIIRHNIVVAIEAVAVSDAAIVASDALAVSSKLAQNNRRNGCLDGEYMVRDGEAARFFAHLSLDFVKRTAEKSIEHLESVSISEAGWINPLYTDDE